MSAKRRTWRRRWHRACYTKNAMRRGVRTRDGRRVILVFSGEPWQRPWKEVPAEPPAVGPVDVAWEHGPGLPVRLSRAVRVY